MVTGRSEKLVGSSIPTTRAVLGTCVKYVINHLNTFPEIVYLFYIAENEYDNTGDEGWLEVEVVDPIFDNMGMEVGRKTNNICFYKTLSGCVSSSLGAWGVLCLYS